MSGVPEVLDGGGWPIAPTPEVAIVSGTVLQTLAA
jgi:hypothetical protein